MTNPWFDPGASIQSWFPQAPATAAAAPPPPADTSFLFTPTVAPAPAPAYAPAPYVAPAAAAPSYAAAPDDAFTYPVGLQQILGALKQGAGAMGQPIATSGLGSLLGALNLYQGITNGNAMQGVGGGLSTVGGLANLGNALGAASPGLSTVGTAAGGLGGLLGLYGGISGLVNGTGSPISNAAQLGSGALGTYGALNALLADSALPTISGALEAIPGLAAALGTGAGTAAGTAAVGTAGAASAVVAPFVLAAILAVQNNDKMNAMKSWANFGAPITQMQETATKDAANGNAIFNEINRLGIQDPNILKAALTAGANDLFPYYDAKDAGASFPLTVGKYYQHTGQDMAPLNSQVNALQGDLWNTIGQLKSLGITNDQLAALPINPKYGDPQLGGMAVQNYRMAGNPGFDTNTIGGMPVAPTNYNSNPGLAAEMSGGYLSRDAVNAATGGPLMSMTAALNPQLYSQMGGGFNFQDPAVAAELERQRQGAAMINQTANQAFTSGGN